jgi:hypothetical protein
MTKKLRARRLSRGDPAAERWLRGEWVGEIDFLPGAPPGGLDSRQLLWRDHADRIIAEYAEEHPGKRPPRWWEYTRPKPAPRQRVGGVGTAVYEHLMRSSGFPQLDCKIGIPAKWISRRDKDWLPFKGCPCCEAVDPADPPKFEAQAVYLQRLNLLLLGEAKRLRPADFEPELVFADQKDPEDSD